MRPWRSIDAGAPMAWPDGDRGPPGALYLQAAQPVTVIKCAWLLCCCCMSERVDAALQGNQSVAMLGRRAAASAPASTTSVDLPS
jgi:hypothetical protein